MKMFVVAALAAAVSVAALPPGAAQDPKPGQRPGSQEPSPKAPTTPPPTAEQVLAEMQAQFAKEGLELDAKAGTLSIKAIVNEARDPIEYLLVHRRGKRHEAVFWTSAKASLLNGALLLLGLEQGKNATYKEVEPLPTLEEVQAGAETVIVTPPQGKPFWVTAHWTTAEGEAKACCVEDLLLDLGTGKPVHATAWIYLGGRMAQIYRNEPEVYIADFEGNLFSVCYMSPDNHLATMVHERARDDQNWLVTELLPPVDTEVKLVVHKQKPKLAVEREARLAKAKPDGEAKPDGKAPAKDAGGAPNGGNGARSGRGGD